MLCRQCGCESGGDQWAKSLCPSCAGIFSQSETEGGDELAANTSWPVALYIVAMIFAWLTLTVFTQAVDGALSGGRMLAQLCIMVVLGLRLAYAMRVKERSRTWIIYVAGMFLALPIWLIAEPLVLAIKHWR